MKTKTPRTIEDWLAYMKTLELPRDADGLKRVIALDRPAAGVAIASAVRRVAEHSLHTVAPDLVAAFKRLEGAERDPGCRGKIAIARCLHDLELWEEEVFVAGRTIVQFEGFNREDTAGELRAVCAIAYAHFLRPDALDVIAELLADPERTTRVGAAQALRDSGHRDAGPLLRYKLLAVRNEEVEVLAACCESLLALSRDSWSFLVNLLADHDDRAEAAALSLGDARVTEAREALATWCQESRPDRRHRAGYLALALLRDDAANAMLADAITSRAKGDAVAAARALATFKDHPPTRELLEVTIAKVKDASLRRELQALLAS
jgi:hypothetical protein